MLKNNTFLQDVYDLIIKQRYTFIFAAWLVLCYFFPYSGDDWAWGSKIGLERLSSWFDNYSGRYLGNLIVLVLTRSNLLKTFVMAFTLTGIAYCSERLIQRKWVPLLVTLSILLTSRLIFRQAIVWTAGFSNYAVSIFLTLCFFVYLNEHNQDTFSSILPDSILLLILGFANCLIVEHFTLFNLQLSIVVLIIYLVRNHKIHYGFLTYAVGCTAGSCWLFSNSVFHSIVNQEDGYRSIMSGGIIDSVLTNYFSVIYREAFLFNWFVNAVIVICIFILLARGIRQKIITGPQKWISLFLCVVLIVFELYTLYYLPKYGYKYRTEPIITEYYIIGTLSALSLIALIVLSVIVTGTRKTNVRLLFLWYSVIMIILPLFVVNPIGSRCFFGTYIIFTLIMCELLTSVSSSEIFNHIVYVVCALALLIVFLPYFGLYSKIHSADSARLESVQGAVDRGEMSAEFVRLPYDNYLWMSSPKKDNDLWEDRYKLFYNIPEDFDLVLKR